MRFVCLAHVRTRPAIAAAEIITSAYSAVLWPASERSPRRSNENSALVSNCNTFDLPVDGHAQRVQQWWRGRRARSAGDPGDDSRDDREERECRKDAADEREAEPDRHRPRPGLGSAAEIGPEFGGEARERGRGGRSEACAHAQRLGE